MAMHVLRAIKNYNSGIFNSVLYPETGLANVLKSSIHSAKQIMAGLEKSILGMGMHLWSLGDVWMVY